mgnify:CR=1 FL=1
MAHGLRLWGNKKLSPSVTIHAGQNDELKLTADGTPYVVFITPGVYEVRHEFFDGPALLNELNQALSGVGAPVTAALGGIHDDKPRTVLVFEHQDTDSAATLAIDETCSCYKTLIETIHGTEKAVQ